MGIKFNPESHLDKLKQHKLALDKDQLWADLELAQNKEKKKRVVYWIFPLFLLLFASSYFLYNQLDNNKNSTVSEKREHSKSSELTLKNKDFNSLRSEDFVSVSRHEISDSENKELNHNDSPNNSISKTANTEKFNTKNLNLPSNGTAETATLLSKKFIKESGESISSKISAGATIDSYDKKDPIIPNYKKINPVVTKPSSTQEKKYKNPKSEAKETSTKTKNSIEKTKLISFPKQVSIISYLQNNLTLIDWEQRVVRTLNQEVVILLPKNKDSDNKTDRIKTKKKFIDAIMVYGGIGKSQKTMTSKTKEYESYAGFRNSIETPLENLSFGIRAEKSLSKNMVFSIGLEYDQLTERMDYTLVDTTATNVEIPNAVIEEKIDKDGNSNLTNGPTTGYDFDQYDYKNYNRFRIIDIPVKISYKISISKFDLGASLGFAINALHRFDGNIVSEQKELGAFENFKNNIGISYLASFDINYRFNKKYELALSPSFKLRPNNITNVDYVLEQKYNSYHLQLGLRRRL